MGGSLRQIVTSGTVKSTHLVYYSVRNAQGLTTDKMETPFLPGSNSYSHNFQFFTDLLYLLLYFNKNI